MPTVAAVFIAITGSQVNNFLTNSMIFQQQIKFLHAWASSWAIKNACMKLLAPSVQRVV